ncbi:MAG TPA: LysR family transcriptional regulator [Verrucomicrobiales bacterium]|nr:LysR family transcriptional regulator [Verrucomicrobiales bacterium]
MPRPTVRELECFVAVAEEQNFTRGARRMSLSQPPFTRQIQSLEQKAGCRLLNRTTRAVSLTRSGELFLTDARELLAQIDRAVACARRAHDGADVRLRLGIVGALMDEETIRVFRRLRRAHPRCQLQLRDLAPNEILSQLIEGKLDGGFIGAMPSRLPASLQGFKWRREPLVLVVPEGHPFAKGGAPRLDQLQSELWVTMAREAAPAFRRQLDQLWRREGFDPRIIHEADRPLALLGMVATGQGISLLPASFSRLLSEGLVFRTFSPRSEAFLEHSFIHRRASRPVELQQLIHELRGRPG